MASLLRRTVILSFSRFAGQAVVLISPLLLVRILTVGEYGSYREFILYAALISSLVSFGISRSLQYLLPKHPEQERVWVTQSVLFVLAFSTAAIVVVYLTGDLIRDNTSFDFVTLLQLYVLFAANLDFIEFYWLGKKRTDNVLYYSATYLCFRMAVVVIAALVTSHVYAIILALVVLEAVRFFLILVYACYRRLFTIGMSRASLAVQLSHFLPQGTGSAIEVLNARAGMLFVSSLIGPEALAFYVIGTFATPIVNVLRGAIADVIFPDIVEVRSASIRDALPLWKRATVWYCVMLFPIAILFSYYADAAVIFLFTKEYTAAIPVFSVFAFMLYLHCFDFHLPLRVQNANRFYLQGSIVAIAVNVATIYPLYKSFGLMGPAVALIVSRLAFTIYLALKTSKLYGVRIKEIALWRTISKVLAASIVCAIVLVVGKHSVDNEITRAMLFGPAYLVVYLLMLRWLGIWNFYELATRMARLRGSEGRQSANGIT